MSENKNIPEKDSRTGIELYNREVSDILGDPPAWLIHSGSYVLYGILAVLLLGSALISYPDVVKGQTIIEDIANVHWVTANSNGKIETFFVKNDSLVKRGDTICVLQNPAWLADVNIFCQMLGNVEEYYLTQNTELLRVFRFDLVMGEMSHAYETFTQAVRNCVTYDDHNFHIEKDAFLQKELKILMKESDKNELAILKVEQERFELLSSHEKEIERNRKGLELAYVNMVNSLRSWDSKYLIKSPTKGKVILGETSSPFALINIGDTICSVISQNKELFIAKMYLEQDKIAEIIPGNIVNIKLSKYPSYNYGVLTGTVNSISFVPHYKMYLISISLPEKLETSAHKDIKYELGLKGEAEIVTSSRSVLSRVFNPIYSLVKSQSNK